MASAVVLAVWALVGWLPAVGLLRLMSGAAGSTVASTVESFRALVAPAGHIAAEPWPLMAANSLVFGLEVACVLTAIAWIVQPENGHRPSTTSWWRFVRPVAQLPPLAVGAGALALPWLAGLASRAMIDAGRPAPGVALDRLATALNPYWKPWTLMVLGVVLALAPRLLAVWGRGAELVAARPHARSASEAALICGASRVRARSLGASGWRNRWLGRFVLVWALGATNLVPSLLFEPWSDWRTVSPGVVILAGGDAAARATAGALAVGALVVNVSAVVVARWTRALPRSFELD
jgi:hypothetical protein